MKFKKNILGTIFWRGIYFVTVLLMNIIIARYFKAAGSGWIYYVTNYFSFIILLGSFSLESGMTFFASSNTISRNKLAIFALLWSAIVSLIIILLLFVYYKQPEAAAGRPQFIFFAGTYASGILLTTFFSALFNAEQDYTLPNQLLTVTNILLILAVPVVASFSNTADAPVVFLNCYFFNFLLQGIVLSIVYIRRNRVFAQHSLPGTTELQQLFRYASFALLANVVFFLLYRIDYWFVKNNCQVCNEGDLGNYIQVSKLGQLFLVLPGMMAAIIFPRTAAGFNKEISIMLPVLCRVMFSIYSILIVLFALTGQFLFPLVYGATFDHMYIPFLLLVPGILGLSSLGFISAYYAGKNKVIVNLTGTSLALAVVITGDILFIPHFGINAAAFISSVAYLTCYFYILLRYKKEYNVPVKDFFIPGGADFKKVYFYVVQQFEGS